MSAGTTVGLLVMLGAVVWCLASLVRAIVGPGRLAALKRSGLAVALFFVGGIVVGTFGARTPPADSARPTPADSARPTPATSVAQTDIAIVQEVAPTSSQAALIVTAPNNPLAVAARYQTSPTLVSLVISGSPPFTADALKSLAQAECADASFCSVGFWTDDSLAPRALRMTPEQELGRLAQYVHSNRTGLDMLKWNCQDGQSPDDCL